MPTNPDLYFDLHIHTPFSDGQWDIERVIQALIRLKVKVAGFADHLFPFALYFHGKKKLDKHRSPGLARMYSASNLIYRKQVIRYYDKKYPQIHLLNGAEIDILPHGGLTIPRGITPDFFDYILVSKHHTVPKPLNLFKKFPHLDEWSWAHSPRKRLMRQLWHRGLVAAFQMNPVDIFAHPQEGMPKFMTTADYKRLVGALKQHNVAMELNHFPLQEHGELLEIAKRHGIIFSIASDFHGFRGSIEDRLQEGFEMRELAEERELPLLDPMQFIPKE